MIVKFNGERYDISSFVPNHPGGSVIKNAKDRNLEDVWEEFGVKWHLKNSRVMETLNKYKIEEFSLEMLWKKNSAVIFDMAILLICLVLFLSLFNL